MFAPRRTAGLIVAVALLAAGPAAGVRADAGSPHAVAAKSCSGRYTHASLPWGHKCLSVGQFCKRGENGAYHRYGFHCKSNGHLRYR